MSFPNLVFSRLSLQGLRTARQHSIKIIYYAVHTRQLLVHEGGAEMCCRGWCCTFANSPEFEQLQLTRKQQEQGRVVLTGKYFFLSTYLPGHTVSKMLLDIKVTFTDLKR